MIKTKKIRPRGCEPYDDDVFAKKCDICEATGTKLKVYRQLWYCHNCLQKVYDKQEHKKALHYSAMTEYYRKRRDR